MSQTFKNLIQVIKTYIISPLKFLGPVWDNLLFLAIITFIATKTGLNQYQIIIILAILGISYHFCKIHYKDIFNFIKNKKIRTICIFALGLVLVLGLIYFLINTIINIQIDQEVDKSTEKFKTEQIEGLKLALTAGQKLEEIIKNRNLNKITDYPTVKPIYALHKIENEIYQSNQIDGIPKEVRIILFSPSGDKIAFAEDKSLHIYDFLKTGAYKSPKQENFDSIITSFNFSEDEDGDGELIAVGLQNGEIQLLDKSLKILDYKPKAHTKEISSVSFSKDKQKLLTTGKDGMVSLWDISNREFTSKPVFSEKHGKYIESASFSPDGSYIATAGEIDKVGTNEEIKLWDSQSGQSRGSIQTDHTKIFSISFTHDGKYIATAGDNVVRIWNTKPDKIGTPILEIKANTVKKVSFSQWKGLELIAAVGNDRIVRVWQFSPDTDNPKPNPSYKLLTELNGHETLAFTQKKPYYLATAGKSSKILIWKFSHQKQIIVTQPENMGALKSIHVSSVNDSNGKTLRLVTLREDNKADIWDLDSEIRNPNNTNNAEDLQKVANISLNSENNKFAVIKTDGTQKISDFSGDKVYKKNTVPQKQVTIATFIPNQDVLASGRKDGKVDFWNFIGGDDTPELDTGFNSEITSLNYSSDGNYLATMIENREVRVFQFSPDKKWKLFTWDAAPTNAVISFIPKSKYIITGEQNSDLSLWEVVNNKIQKIDIQQWQSNHHTGKIETVISSPDGNYIASLDAKGEPKLWHLSIDKKKKPSVKEIHNLDRQNSGVAKITTLTFSPSYEFGQLMAAGDEKGRIYVWDMKGRKIAEFKPEGEESKVTHITFSPKTNSDNFIVAAYNNGTVRSWQVAGLNHLLEDGCDWLKGYFSSHPNSLLPVCKQLGLTQLAQ